MKKIGYLIFASLIFSIVALFNSLQLTADAATINFSALKSGTSDTSYADAYMVKPAELNIVNNKYQVTYTIKTQKALGKYPVQVKSMNVNTTGIRNYEDGGNYYSAITFESDQLSNITGTMTINVDSYNIHATHTFTLKFYNIPSLHSGGSSQAPSASNGDGNQGGQAADAGQNNNAGSDNGTDGNKDNNKSDDNGEKAVTIGKPKKLSNKSKKKAPTKKQDSKTKAIEKKDKKNKSNNINIPRITAITTIVVLVAGGGYFATKKFF
ncbi:NEAT domain-containing protein [Companilactobacillus insicii]|uniref:NEAT domain-containing protein n=1 Tax=Companilactobacillus insicii TaxID=1732567 RepID=UPI000F76EB86|nr:NEAT domain-containing protein [Companilactobacillus insicii]